MERFSRLRGPGRKRVAAVADGATLASEGGRKGVFLFPPGVLTGEWAAGAEPRRVAAALPWSTHRCATPTTLESILTHESASEMHLPTIDKALTGHVAFR